MQIPVIQGYVELNRALSHLAVQIRLDIYLPVLDLIFIAFIKITIFVIFFYSTYVLKTCNHVIL